MEIMAEQGTEEIAVLEKKTRFRGLGSLTAIRKELVRLYHEARTAGAIPEKVQYFRALTFILSTAAQVKKDESLEEIETRLKALEERECANH